MNLFQIVLLDVILLIFPILIYLLYLSTNKNMTTKSKRIYLVLALASSFFSLSVFGVNELSYVQILVLNSIVIFLYLENRFIVANVFSALILVVYSGFFNNILFLVLIYILIAILYLIKRLNKINNLLFIQLCIAFSSLVFVFWIYKFNNDYFYIEKVMSIIIAYFFIVNIMCLMYEVGQKILQTHLTFKELQQEKQIRLSLFKITHEIKNPIAVCKGYLDMLNVKDTRQVERYIPIIKSEIERLLSLLQDFLLINKNNLELDVMDFNMLIEDTIKKLEPLLNDNKINLNLNIIDDEIFINGDYNKLSQVLINIIKNSIEAIPKGKNGKIFISTKLTLIPLDIISPIAFAILP